MAVHINDLHHRVQSMPPATPGLKRIKVIRSDNYRDYPSPVINEGRLRHEYRYTPKPKMSHLSSNITSDECTPYMGNDDDDDDDLLFSFFDKEKEYNMSPPPLPSPLVVSSTFAPSSKLVQTTPYPTTSVPTSYNGSYPRPHSSLSHPTSSLSCPPPSLSRPTSSHPHPPSSFSSLHCPPSSLPPLGNSPFTSKRPQSKSMPSSVKSLSSITNKSLPYKSIATHNNYSNSNKCYKSAQRNILSDLTNTLSMDQQEREVAGPTSLLTNKCTATTSSCTTNGDTKQSSSLPFFNSKR